MLCWTIHGQILSPQSDLWLRVRFLVCRQVFVIEFPDGTVQYHGRGDDRGGPAAESTPG